MTGVNLAGTFWLIGNALKQGRRALGQTQ